MGESMGIEESLTRLGVKVQSFSDTGGSFDALTPHDLAAALSGCNKIGQEVIWRRVMEESLKEQGILIIYNAALDLVINRKLLNHFEVQVMTSKILEVAITDYAIDHNCRTCGGTKEVYYGKLKRTCPSKTCRNGKRYRTDRERAKDIGVSASTYCEKYKRVYVEIDRYLTKALPNAESEALTELKGYFK